MSSKRSLLGFDDSDEEFSDVTQTVVKKNVPLRKNKLPKLSFEQDQTIDGDKGEEDKLNDKVAESEDYLDMEIQEDEAMRSQRLFREKSPLKFVIPENNDTTVKRLKTSLFGEVVIPEDETNSQPLTKLENVPLKSSKSKGLSIMEKMGFNIGETLGKDSHNQNALLEPIITIPRSTKLGIGKPEKPEDDVYVAKEITKKDEEEFKNRLKEEKNEKRKENILRRMQKCGFQFSEQDGEETDVEKVQLRDVNVLWRSYVKFVRDKLREQKEEMRLQRINDAVEQTVVSNNMEEVKGSETGEDEEEGEDLDGELELFEEQSLDEKIERLNLHLRSEHAYCFYCGVKYEDQADLYANCPGQTEEDHQ